MLVPGECLIRPPDEKPTSAPPAGRAGESAPPTLPAAETKAEAKEAEPRPFLLILLRALGAIHT
jgi:hypothetical protein